MTLAATVYPQHGYPYLLETTVHYELVADGLKVTHYLRNLGHESAPVAIGTHPFLAHRRRADRLAHPAARRGEPHRGRRPAAADGRGSRSTAPSGTCATRAAVGELQLDDAWGEAFATDGEVVHTLTAPDGRTVSMWAEPEFGFVQVFTTRQFPGRDGDAAIAIEPMTAPADAFNSGKGLRWLAPGRRVGDQLGHPLRRLLAHAPPDRERPTKSRRARAQRTKNGPSPLETGRSLFTGSSGRRHQHGVDEVHRGVGGVDATADDLGVVDHEVVAAAGDLDGSTLDGGLRSDDVSGRRAGRAPRGR